MTGLFEQRGTISGFYLRDAPGNPPPDIVQGAMVGEEQFLRRLAKLISSTHTAMSAPGPGTGAIHGPDDDSATTDTAKSALVDLL